MNPKTQRIAWVREYRHNRGNYDSATGSFTAAIKNARLFDRKKDAEAAGCIAVKVVVTVERFVQSPRREIDYGSPSADCGSTKYREYQGDGQ